MKPVRIILVSFLILIVMGIIAGTIFIRYSSRKALPDYGKNIVLEGLHETVRVYRDSTAMPHVYARNNADLYRSAGYVMAQDRIWQMDLLRRLTLGRLSEIFGREMTEVDQLFRALNFTEKSGRVLDSCSVEMKCILESYAEGVNQYLNDNRGKLPPEFSILGYEPERWKPEHSVNLIGYMSWSLNMGWSTEVLMYKLQEKLDPSLFSELVPEMSLQMTHIIPLDIKNREGLMSGIEHIMEKVSSLGLQVFQASNNWVVSSWKSRTGHPLLANDMHLELNVPGIWYQMHQVIEGELNVSGVVLPGQPFIICGHNDRVAWGMTNVMLDDMDFYLETTNPLDSSEYRLNGEWVKFRVKKEEIVTHEGDTVIRYNRFTHRGPVISKFKEFDKPVISMAWTGNLYSNELRSVYLFNRMQNWKDFQNAAKSFISISQNIAYADVDGNIGIQITGGIPLRKGEGIFILPGDTTLYDWKGIVDFSELPCVYNPESGYVASANNRTISDDYPYYISNWYDLPNRAERIIEELESREKLSVKDMMDIQRNQNSKWAEKLIPFFIESMGEELDQQPEKIRNAFMILGKWDFDMSPQSVEATLFEQFYLELVKQVFKDELREELFHSFRRQKLIVSYYMDKIRRGGESAWFDNVDTPDKKERLVDLLPIAMNDALDILGARLGEDQSMWNWGRVHQLFFSHPLGRVDALNRAFKLNRGPFPVGGSYHTVSPYSFSVTDLFNSRFGSSHRHIYVPGDWEASRIVIPTGISGIPSSPYYMDQTQDYINYRYKPELFTETTLARERKYIMEFRPQ